ncbi:DUF924 family protein [Lusitaniella coriacea]|uniref:DUF924 family protein n=1 Tax=Lusitaniella coriacea TaxID=1983105 RepID=UPI003CF5156E
MASIQAILDFWFGKPGEGDYGKPRSVWFVKNAAFDEEIRSRFLDAYERAATGEFSEWKETPLGSLALILLLDQFPRNLFRNHPKAFATDAYARSVTVDAITQNFDQTLLPVQRWFIYLPLEHSENLEDQNRCVELFSQLKDDPHSASTIDYARRHRDVIQRFGRFPHRNKILGRKSTPQEEEFLQQPGSSF